MKPIYCEFCGWETTDADVRVCPKCHEYKGLVRNPSIDERDLDAKIAAFKAAHPEWGSLEP